MIELIREIPITFDPNWTDKWLVWVTIASVVASTAVAFLAWRTSRDAKAIADSARQTQIAIHESELEDAYSARLNSALARFFRKITDQNAILNAWLEEAEEVEIYGRVDQRKGDLMYPAEPTFETIAAELEIVYLVARDSDVKVIESIDSTLEGIAGTDVYRRWEYLVVLMTAVRRWRSGSWPETETIVALGSVREAASKPKGAGAS